MATFLHIAPCMAPMHPFTHYALIPPVISPLHTMELPPTPPPPHSPKPQLHEVINPHAEVQITSLSMKALAYQLTLHPRHPALLYMRWYTCTDATPASSGSLPVPTLLLCLHRTLTTMCCECAPPHVPNAACLNMYNMHHPICHTCTMHCR